jgi:cytochrome c biogenesis protein CcmG/thiol:disulfide interchange protein DsbE
MKSSRPKQASHRFITIGLAAAVIVMLLILLKGLFLNPSVVKSSQIGKPAKDFEVEVLEGGSWLPKTNGTKVRLSDLRGHLVILNFWASWCVSCRQEAGEMEQFWTRKKDSGVIVLGVAIQDTPASAREFAQAHGKTYPIALDESGKTSIDYGVYGVPETFAIDASGVIIQKEAGPVTAKLLEEWFSQL